jgi:hypothetical protein
VKDCTYSEIIEWEKEVNQGFCETTEVDRNRGRGAQKKLRREKWMKLRGGIPFQDDYEKRAG